MGDWDNCFDCEHFISRYRFCSRHDNWIKDKWEGRKIAKGCNRFKKWNTKNT